MNMQNPNGNMQNNSRNTNMINGQVQPRPNTTVLNATYNPFMMGINNNNTPNDDLSTTGIIDMYGNTESDSKHLYQLQNNMICSYIICTDTGKIKVTHEKKTKTGYLPLTIFHQNSPLKYPFLVDTGSNNNWIGATTLTMIENYAKENNIPYTIEDSNVTSQTGGN